jgi:hypothetical protein
MSGHFGRQAEKAHNPLLLIGQVSFPSKATIGCLNSPTVNP